MFVIEHKPSTKCRKTHGSTYRRVVMYYICVCVHCNTYTSVERTRWRNIYIRVRYTTEGRTIQSFVPYALYLFGWNVSECSITFDGRDRIVSPPYYYRRRQSLPSSLQTLTKSWIRAKENTNFWIASKIDCSRVIYIYIFEYTIHRVSHGDLLILIQYNVWILICFYVQFKNK